MSRVCFLFRLLTAVSIMILLAGCCWHCISIYTTGQMIDGYRNASMYSMPDVTNRLRTLIPFAIAAFSLILITIILQFFERPSSSKVSPPPDNLLRMLKSHCEHKLDLSTKETIYRRRIMLFFGLPIFACCSFVLVYLLNIHHFTSWDLEEVLSQMLLKTLPWITVAFALAVTMLYSIRNSKLREIQAIRKRKQGSAPVKCPPRKKPPVSLHIILISIALLMILHGMINGGMYDVLVKAINICTECIGLG